MLGRPEICVPVFMNVCAGSWLICSVCIERTMQMSSAMPPMSREERRASPARTRRSCVNGCCGPKHFSAWPCSCAIGWPLVNDSGIGWPCRFVELRLVVEQLEVRRPAGQVEVDDPLRLRREVQRAHDAGRDRGAAGASAGGAARSAFGSRSDRNAAEPRPAPARARKLRRATRRRSAARSSVRIVFISSSSLTTASGPRAG